LRTWAYITIADIQPLTLVTTEFEKAPKYRQIEASILEVGIVEPPVVTRDRSRPRKYLLLDGHLRIEILKDMGHTDALCPVSTDDEAVTYNKRVNRLSTVQEHQMILKAVERGVSEERIAKALNVDIPSMRRKRHLLDGICAEVAEKDEHIAAQTFSEFQKMARLRQIEAAELMVAMNNYTLPRARNWSRLSSEAPEGSDQQIALMERESVNLEREFRIGPRKRMAPIISMPC
jgi:ParB-like chromosome segregation protein Spo0J